MPSRVTLAWEDQTMVDHVLDDPTQLCETKLEVQEMPHWRSSNGDKMRAKVRSNFAAGFFLSEVNLFSYQKQTTRVKILIYFGLCLQRMSATRWRPSKCEFARLLGSSFLMRTTQ